jgi:DnaT-like ssDNA binding protein
MGAVLTLTIGSATYSVYAPAATPTDPVAQANTYFAAHSGAAAWANADTLTKKKALVTATRAIDRARWTGTKLVPSQSTAWPRTGASCFGEAEPDGVPDEVGFGTFEYALLILSDPTVVEKPSTESNVESVKAGTAAVSFFAPKIGDATKFPTVVHDLIGCFLSGAATDVGVPFFSGTDEVSAFGPDDFERTEGFS